ncbi:hypothetical protein [Paenibacillus abyssi]|uniref:Uncharacterized protein n=1 Tax=Paenibacillus abyssi TaxID=1340531 RepID=A0A917G2L2_9BACL|nr:hypothetical protein [Paenibacillus abyssi]GGG18804.1 hypothetical protein GCM10010916_39520 [Paenibacillus abyssi]
MKEIITKILLIAIALSAFTFFVVTGLWTDSKTTDGRKDAEVTRAVIPQN